MSTVKVVKNTLKGGSFGTQTSDYIWKFISLCQHTVCIEREIAVCKFLCWFHFLVHTDLWNLILFAVFAKECKYCSTARIQWHCIQAVNATMIMKTWFFSPCIFTYFTKTALFLLYRWKNWSVERLRDLSDISEWVRGRDWESGFDSLFIPLFTGP